MTELGIFEPDGEPYAELAGDGGPRTFRKHILTVGKTFVHPKTGKPLTVDEAWYSKMKANFDRNITGVVQFPAADANNAHTEDPLRNLGRVTNLGRDGARVYVDVQVPDAEIAGKIGSTILGASAMISMDYLDSTSGQRVGPALCHVAATNRPFLTDLADYEEVVGASAEGWDTYNDGSMTPPDLVMLCAASEESVTLAGLDEGMALAARIDAELDDAELDDYTGGTTDMPQYEEDSFRAKYGESAEGAIYRASINPVIAAGTGAGPGAEPGVRINRLRNGTPPQRGWKASDDVRHSEAVMSAETHLSAPEPDDETFQHKARELSARSGVPFGEAADAIRELAFSEDEDTANEPGALSLAADTLLGYFAASDDDVIRMAQEADTADLLGLSARATVDEDEDEDEDNPVKAARKNGARTRKDVVASEVQRLHEKSLAMFGKRDTTEAPHGAVKTHSR